MSQPTFRSFLVAARGGIMVFFAVVLGLAWVAYQQYARSYRAESHARLSAIAEMKASEVADWRDERLADGRFFEGNRAVIELAQRVFKPGGDAEAAATLRDLLGRMQRTHQYSRVALHDADGLERLSSTADGMRDDGHMAASVREAVAHGGAAFIAMHANDGETPHLSIIAPLQPGLGAVLVWIDAAPALRGFVNSWPVPTETAETLIVRRAGDDVVFLNAVVGPDEAKATRQVPMTRTDLPAVQAVLGNRGTIETIDRRGVPVVAAMLPIEETGWFLVVTEAQTELYGPLRDRAIMLVTIALLLLVAGVAVLVAAWRGAANKAASVARDHLEALNNLSQVVEASPVVVFRWRAVEGWPVEWVSSNVSRWGYTPEELMRDVPPFRELVHPNDTAAVAQEVARYTAEGRDSFTQEYRVVAANGTVMWMEDRTSVVRDAEGRVVRYQGVLTDITERRHLQAQFVQAQKMETVGRLAGAVAHDFNNLLTVINGYSEFALAEVSPEDPVREMLQEIHDAGTRAAALTRQLLAFSRKQPAKLEVLDCNGIADRMKKLLGRLIGEDVSLTFDLDPALWRVRADVGQIEQIIMNLAINARDAMPEGGTIAVASRNVRLEESESSMSPSVPAGEYVLLSVADTGCGIDEATRAHMFEPFFTTKASGHGTGLGLSTVHGFVTASRGSIRVRSTVGRGTKFEVYLPRVESSHAVTSAEPELSVTPGQGTVLLVEDDAALRRVAERILTAAGYVVIGAATGVEALAQLDVHATVDLVLTDMVMPGMSGDELVTEVLRRRPEVKVLMASGYVRDAFPQRATQSRGFTFIAKPYSPSTLTRAVREVLLRT